jgi:hypothetical protein
MALYCSALVVLNSLGGIPVSGWPFLVFIVLYVVVGTAIAAYLARINGLL